MRSKGQISQKLKQVRFRHMKRQLEELLVRRPSNCANNKQLDLPAGGVGLCELDCETCDLTVNDRSPGCEDYTPQYSKGEVKKSLKQFFDTKGAHEIAVRFPDVAALKWALEGDEEEPSYHEAELFGVSVYLDGEDELREVEVSLAEYELREAKLLMRAEAAEKRAQEEADSNALLRESLDDSEEALKEVRKDLDSYRSDYLLTRDETHVLKKQIEVLKKQVEEAQKELPEPRLPWWKRIFR